MRNLVRTHLVDRSVGYHPVVASNLSFSNVLSSTLTELTVACN